jgi:AraC family transcriptional regulator of adaptative response/methylated-DNA-[protein]-cysteine methyltransferase
MQHNISIKKIDSPLGVLTACAGEDGIYLVEFDERTELKQELEKLEKDLNARIQPGDNEHLTKLAEELKDYFSGSLKEFSVPLVLTGTGFQRLVWTKLQEIPYGKTRTYLQQANALGNPAAIRAVAQANGQNKIAILVPCHRVIGSDGQLTGYAGGLWRKRFLLDLEKETGRPLSLFDGMQV